MASRQYLTRPITGTHYLKIRENIRTRTQILITLASKTLGNGKIYSLLNDPLTVDCRLQLSWSSQSAPVTRIPRSRPSLSPASTQKVVIHSTRPGIRITLTHDLEPHAQTHTCHCTNILSVTFSRDRITSTVFYFYFYFILFYLFFPA